MVCSTTSSRDLVTSFNDRDVSVNTIGDLVLIKDTLTAWNHKKLIEGILLSVTISINDVGILVGKHYGYWIIFFINVMMCVVIKDMQNLKCKHVKL